MERSAPRWLAAAFAACFFAVGAPYWRIPYHAASLPGDLVGPGLVVVGVAALLLRASGTATLVRAVLGTALAVPLAILARVAVETAQDPTRHNLWPFEVVIALGVGLPCGLAGALAGSLLAWLRARRSRVSGGAS